MAKDTVSKEYTFYIQIRSYDYEKEIEEILSLNLIPADNVEELFLLVKPIWLQALDQISKQFGDENTISLSVDCEEIIRNKDQVSYCGDENIPQGPDVADELIELLDP